MYKPKLNKLMPDFFLKIKENKKNLKPFDKAVRKEERRLGRKLTPIELKMLRVRFE